MCSWNNYDSWFLVSWKIFIYETLNLSRESRITGRKFKLCYMVKQFQLRLAGIGWKRFDQRKVSCLSSYLLPIHKKNLPYLTDSQYWRNNFRLHLSQWISIGNRVLWNAWLLLLGNIFSKLSTIIDYFEISTFVIHEQTQI